MVIKTQPREYERFNAGNHEVVIVLDYSGSMNTITKASGAKKSRKDEALAALEKALVKMPKGVKVTLLTFGAESDGRDITPQWKKVEWDPSPEAVHELIRKLGRLTPKGDTPLVRATAEAKKHFTPGFEGAKTVLVVTDGGDTELKDPKLGADLRRDGETQEKYLRGQLGTTRIPVNTTDLEDG